MADVLSIRAFGRLVGVTDTAVRKAIATGRLGRGVGERDGRPAIVDVEAARTEWSANRSRPRPARAPRAARADGSLADWQRQIAAERCRRLKLENDRRDGQLLPVDQVERAHKAVAAATRASLLAVPRRAVLAGLPKEHEPLVRQLVTEALRELSAIGTMAALEAVEADPC